MKQESNNVADHRDSLKSRSRIPAFSLKTNKTQVMDDSVLKLPTWSPKTGSSSTSHNIVGHGSYLAPAKDHHVVDVNEPELVLQKDSGRERLKRHREEVAGRVLIPDTWGQEELLKDWVDYSSFDALLAPNGIASAREALVAEGGRASSRRLRIETRC